jgi:hypothetical protein
MVSSWNVTEREIGLRIGQARLESSTSAVRDKFPVLINTILIQCTQRVSL